MSTYKYPEKKVLLVDDEPEILEGYSLALPANGINHLKLCSDSRQVMPLLEKEAASVVVLDLSMPHITGQELIGMLSENYPDLPIIVVTGTTDIQLAIECIKSGVYDYMLKPVEINRLVSNIRKAMELGELKNEVHNLGRGIINDNLQNPGAFTHIKTVSSAMRSIFRYIEAIAPSPKPLIITGESGVGKEIVAQTVHQLSQRPGQFIPVNVGGLDDTLFADTLFGHKRGAFTGADRDRDGLVKKAEGGTLFLDEIGDIDPKSQIKLLRLLQENQYYPLGSDTPLSCNIRTIIATNVDLQEKQERGEFRKDLYYRLMTHYITIPPLRERFEDLPILLEHFLEKACAILNRPYPVVPEGIFTLMQNYHFPGNIRELEAIIHNTLSISAPETFSLEAIKDYIRQHAGLESGLAEEGDPTKILNVITNNNKLPTLKEMEAYLLNKALERAQGNQSVAAPLVGLTPSTFCRRLQKINARE